MSRSFDDWYFNRGGFDIEETLREQGTPTTEIEKKVHEQYQERYLAVLAQYRADQQPSQPEPLEPQGDSR